MCTISDLSPESQKIWTPNVKKGFLQQIQPKQKIILNCSTFIHPKSGINLIENPQIIWNSLQKVFSVNTKSIKFANTAITPELLLKLLKS